MRTSTILFAILFVMHNVTVLNILIFKVDWMLVFYLSNILFLIGAFYYGIEARVYRERKRKGSS
ncbi:hypothetical protein GKZ89_15905 [Bacillus mangrovi]|uniref:Uncharacterized protein n=1 Tax=Metabacillus mangrovi TaxID=1491830 RepID=A0A7X2S756_9BACI|nr:hypothetical protein [Metabacillus mangrovi]MTH54887.1 hypothetical protein [Metabacillus mangrovi]